MSVEKRELVLKIEQRLKECFSLPKVDKEFIQNNYFDSHKKEEELRHVLLQLDLYLKYQESRGLKIPLKKFKARVCKTEYSDEYFYVDAIDQSDAFKKAKEVVDKYPYKDGTEHSLETVIEDQS